MLALFSYVAAVVVETFNTDQPVSARHRASGEDDPRRPRNRRERRAGRRRRA